MKSVFVALPAYGQTNTTHTTASLVALALQLPLDGYQMTFGTYSYFDLVRMRNLMLTFWYDQQKASHMLFVDADMAFDPVAVIRMLERDVPLTGVIYPRRSNSLGFVGSFLSNTTPVDGFMPVRGVGGGLMLIRRDCIERLLADQPELSDTRPTTSVMHGDLMREMGIERVIRAFDILTVEEGDVSREFGEDLSFCERVRRAGMDVWGDVGDPVGHVGLHEWYGCYGQPVSRPERAAA